MERVCVIGAGSSGLAACQVLRSRGISFDCFEAGSTIGGNWRYDNDNGMSSAYASLRANSSRRGMAYTAFPMPAQYPDYPGHALVASYLDDFADRFGLHKHIRFRHQVTRVEPAAGGGWKVTVAEHATGTERTQRYRAVLVANGHHWLPRWPEPAFPGEATFTGTQIHSHSYRTPAPFAGKRVLIVGIGNSACDIAVECSHVAARTLLATRHGAHVVPKYLLGVPTDHLTLMRLGPLVPFWLRRRVVAMLVRATRGPVTRYGLPRPDHPILCVHPTVSDTVLARLRGGHIVVKPAIAAFDEDVVSFADGSTECVDAIIYCTGYKISFPFLSGGIIRADRNEVDLYHRVVPPGIPGLYFIGLLQPIGAIMPLAEAQSHWVADLLQGRAALPPEPEMWQEIRGYRARTARRYVPSPRHTIQVDFLAYKREIRGERRAGLARVRHAAVGDSGRATTGSLLRHQRSGC